MQILNIQDNKANLHMTHNLVMAQVAMRQLQRKGQTVISIDVNGPVPVIHIEPPLNGKEPLCAFTSTNRGIEKTTARLYHCGDFIAKVHWMKS